MNKRKRLPKIMGISLLVIVLIIAIALVYIVSFLPAVQVEALQVKATPERLARGRYLFNTVAGCQSCHSVRDASLLSMPIKDGTDGQGGELFDKKVGFPGTYFAKNITPYHLSDWSDGELFRAITSGISKDGHALFPVMPYPEFGKADKEDIYAVIAYVRSLQPIKKDWPASHSDFPMNIIIHTIPARPDFHPIPDKKNTVQYGGYLVNFASCMICHSQENKGTLIAGLEFGGGRPFQLETGVTVVSANITPDAETGIGNWTKESFVQRFRFYGDSSFKPSFIKAGSYNTIMPWTQLGKMSVEDLSAIYDYLRTIKPIKNKVSKFSAGS
jgi:hypothetical protein